MADCACLAGYAAAVYAANNIKLFFCIRKNKRLVNNELKSIKAEIIVYISVINGNLTCAGIYANAGNGFFSSACAVEIWIGFVHNLLTSLRIPKQRAAVPHACALRL